MANKAKKKSSKKRPNRLLDNIVLTNNARAKKDIRQWRVALQQAENVESPKRLMLYNLYDELALDAHYTSEVQKRTLAIRGAKFSIYNQTDGVEDAEKTMLLNRTWFYKFIDLAIESIFWGHSLIQIEDIEDGEISDITLVKRRHIRPEFGLFVKNQNDEKGVSYREDPATFRFLIEIGDPCDLGLLNRTAPHILYKRFAMGAWSEFTEVFGMPIRVAKTNSKDVESLNRMENMMAQMSSAFYAVIDDQETIEFVESSKSNGEVYQGLIDKCNSELSKLVNGAVTGEASKGGSRSKEEVGERTGGMITLGDKQFLEGYINEFLIPQLIELGYPFQGFAFRFEKSKNIDALWKITQGLLPHYDVDTEYIGNTFGVPVKEKTVQANQKVENGFFD